VALGKQAAAEDAPAADETTEAAEKPAEAPKD
jgi:hypothetical protein